MTVADFVVRTYPTWYFEYYSSINIIYFLGAKARVSANVGLSAGLQARS